MYSGDICLMGVVGGGDAYKLEMNNKHLTGLVLMCCVGWRMDGRFLYRADRNRIQDTTLIRWLHGGVFN